jgi:hypothetical protein
MPKIGYDFFNQPSFLNTDPDAQRARPVVSCFALCGTAADNYLGLFVFLHPLTPLWA